MISKPIPLEDLAKECFYTGKDSELFMDLDNGDLYKVSQHPRYKNPYLDYEEALDLEADGKFVRLPKARDINEFEIMEDYIEEVDEKLARSLLTALKQPNPFQSFRNILDREGLLPDYYQYRNEAGAQYLEEWAEDNTIPWRHQISLFNFDSNYTLQKLNEKDSYALLEIYRSNPQFLQLSGHIPSLKSIEADLCRTPEGVSLDQKFYLGIYENHKLIALCDLILDYPNNKEAWIELFMVDGKEQNQGIGSAIIKGIENMLSAAGIGHAELSILKENKQGLSFWLKNGYIKKSENKDREILEKELPVQEEIYEPEWEEEKTEWIF